MMLIKLSLLGLAFFQITSAIPSNEQCEPSGWIVGSTAYQPMGVLAAGSPSTCAITGLPATFNPCQEYTVTVASTSRDLAHKIWAASGILTGGIVQSDCRHTERVKQSSSSYTWKAPSGQVGSVDFKSLCGALNNGATLLVASQTVNRNLAAPSFDSGCPVPTSSPTSVAPTLSPTNAPTLSPPIGPDGSNPAVANNWRNQAGLYSDLRVAPGQRIQFSWTGTHSLLQYKNQADFDRCAFENATTLAPLVAGGSFLLTVPASPGTLWLSCGVAAHCNVAGQKLRVFVELPAISPSGIAPPPPNNWKVQTYSDLVVQRGQEVTFNWTGTHSLVRFANQVDFDACSLDKATRIVGPVTGGVYVFRASQVGNFWLGCSVGPHCGLGMKVKIIVTAPQVGLDGGVAAANNWKLQPYSDLKVPKGTEVSFAWNGLHSLLRLPGQSQFDVCDFTDKVVVAAATSPGSSIFETKKLAVGDVNYFACGVATHCATGSMKIKILIDRVKIGPDAVFPVQKNNWRTKPYSDLRVQKATDLTLLWDGTHSVVKFNNQADWDACNLTAATVIAPPAAGGNITISFDTPGTTTWIGCGVAAHCASLNQKLRIFVDEDPVIAQPGGPTTSSPTDSPATGAAGDPTNQSTNDAGVIVGSISGVLVAAAIVAYRRRRSRSRSTDDGKRGLYDTDEPQKELDVEAGKENRHSFPSLQPERYVSMKVPEAPVSTATLPKKEAQIKPDVQTTMASPASPATLRADRAESVTTTMASKVEEFRIAAKASASTLKKTFKEKREIAMRSFRPIVALDIPVPPPPSSPPPADSTSSNRSTFKPHPMYGQVSVKLPVAGLKPEELSRPTARRDEQTVAKPDSTQPGTSAANVRSPVSSAFNSASRPEASTSTTSSSSARPRFAATATEMSSPDNFRDVATKIKQSVKSRASEVKDKAVEMKEKAKSIRRGARKPEHASGASLVLVSEEGSNGATNTSSSNPIFETLHEEIANASDREDDPADTNGVAKPYGSLRNHPLYGRTLSV